MTRSVERVSENGNKGMGKVQVQEQRKLKAREEELPHTPSVARPRTDQRLASALRGIDLFQRRIGSLSLIPTEKVRGLLS